MTSKNTDLESLRLLYELVRDYTYNPPSYTCIQEFSNNFTEPANLEFTASPGMPEAHWQLEAPFPKIYTKHYKKSILTTLR